MISTIIDTNISFVKNKISRDIDNNVLFSILFDMNRYFDRNFVEILQKEHIRATQSDRNLLRKYYYYGINDYLENVGISSFPRYKATDTDKINVLNSFIERCKKYDEEKIIKSATERYHNIETKNINDNTQKWLDYYDKKRKKNSIFSLFIFDYSQKNFEKDNYDVNNILRVIADVYDQLENYRHLIFKLDGKLFDKNNEDVTWKTLYKIGIYCENFIQFNEKFLPFKKKNRIEKLTDFLDERFNNKENKKLAEDFYSSISAGFKFEDCFVSESQETVILTYQKIKLDNSPIPCPVCMTTIQNGNSFPEMFLRSYECKNPNCAERSKSGRGKRFDEYGTYRYLKLVENRKENIISDELYSKWRKDVFSADNDVFEMLINYYAWNNEKVCLSQKNDISNPNGRKIIYYKHSTETHYNYDFEQLPICKFFNEIKKLLPKTFGNKILKNEIEIINEDSTDGINALAQSQIGAAITSPPYYNAREYSQWNNEVMYFVDMMRNCNAVFHSLIDNGFYLYNIGDIVNYDNIYVESNMSKKRLQLGFLSCLIFEKVGFNLTGNIIWHKGEVQSKRNSTMNHNSGYIKPVNCYEHVLVFKKGRESRTISDVRKITPVIKINSKGENTYKHTAPYPLELVDLLKPFVVKDKYVLDPFLGSGTTLKWCKKNHLKGIGYEFNKEYFELAKNNVNRFNELF